MNAITNGASNQKTYVTSDRGRDLRPTPIGLSPKDIADLRLLLCELQGEVGLRSPAGAIAERLATLRQAKTEAGARSRAAVKALRKRLPDGSPLPMLDADDLVTAWPTTTTAPPILGEEEDRILGLIDRRDSPLSRAGRTFRRLAAVFVAEGGARHVEVLRRLYGPRNPSNEHAAFGDVAPLAAMTGAVERAREGIACADGSARDTRTAASYDAEHPRLQAQTEEHFWTLAERIANVEERAAVVEGEWVLVKEQALTSDSDAVKAKADKVCAKLSRRVVWLETRAAALREHMADALYEFEMRAACFDRGRLSARLSAMASADIEITPEDALRTRMAPASPALPKDARTAYEAARKAFIAEVRREAEQLRVRAASAFREAGR